MWTLRKGEQEAAIDLRPVLGIGAEIVLTVDGELRRSRLYRAHEQAELAGAIADTRTAFEVKGWALDGGPHRARVTRGAGAARRAWIRQREDSVIAHGSVRCRGPETRGSCRTAACMRSGKRVC